MAISSTESYGEQIPHFLKSFLSKPASALPKGAFWVVDFNNLNNVKEAILQTAKLERNQGWNIEEGLNRLINDTDYSSKGCLFCQAVSLPGEQAIANPEGIQKNHFIRTVTGDGRGDYAPNGLRMVFLDTNVSFVDNVIRPWVLTTARLGMIARSGDTQYRQNIDVYKLGVLTYKDKPFVLQKYEFDGACPIEVSAEEYNYTPASAPVNREATFVFHSYRLDTDYNKKNLTISENANSFPTTEVGRLSKQI